MMAIPFLRLPSHRCSHPIHLVPRHRGTDSPIAPHTTSYLRWALSNTIHPPRIPPTSLEEATDQAVCLWVVTYDHTATTTVRGTLRTLSRLIPTVSTREVPNNIIGPRIHAFAKAPHHGMAKKRWDHPMDTLLCHTDIQGLRNTHRRRLCMGMPNRTSPPPRKARLGAPCLPRTLVPPLNNHCKAPRRRSGSPDFARY